MRRAGRLFADIVATENLRLAFCRAARGKRRRAEVMRFAAALDERLADMRIRLLDGTFPVGRFRQFEIHDTKRRIITAPDFLGCRIFPTHTLLSRRSRQRYRRRLRLLARAFRLGLVDERSLQPWLEAAAAFARAAGVRS